jgi:hypothetical protein
MAVIRDVIWNRVELPGDLESLSMGTHVLSSSRGQRLDATGPDDHGGAFRETPCPKP